ncbi:hypothetical protein [Halobacterium sp. CBA1126]|uniref:hypothetical protein n=1 Tax=Halobacterium sp. CBA1126 TaxID=2668074 RepID=UPI001E368086|nr:hypothetical protein [Halobacterium sp. CBA1126]
MTEYELDIYLNETKIVYAKKHEDLWVTFVEEAVERAIYPEVKGTPELSKAEFAEKIRDPDLVTLSVLERSDCSARFLGLFAPRHIVCRERFVNRLIKTH